MKGETQAEYSKIVKKKLRMEMGISLITRDKNWFLKLDDTPWRRELFAMIKLTDGRAPKIEAFF